jgi:tetratricopeptide (TPR) repeat protein
MNLPLSTEARPERTISWFLRLLAIAAPIAVFAVALGVGPGWFAELPRPLRRAFIDMSLRTLCAVQTGLFLAAVIGAPLYGSIVLRARRRRMRRPIAERGLLFSLSCLVAILALEVGATTWRFLVHRFPHLPSSFKPSQPDEYRIVVLGGSSALGEPYRPWLSVGQIVAWKLQEAVPKRQFVCQILAALGHSLEQQHRKLAKLERKPDAVIIYSGHNEFAARFGEERDAEFAGEPANSLLRVAYKAASISQFRRVCRELFSRNRIDAPPLSGRHRLIDPPVASEWESEEVRDDFRERLDAIVTYCDHIGALPILIIPPANEARYEPNRSILPVWVTPEERQRVASEFQQARAGEALTPDASIATYQSILARHPGFAEAHFRLGELLERQRRFQEAAGHYLAALDEDGMPIRCPAPLRAVYYEVASRHPRAILIDGPKELRAASPNGLLGDEMIHDTHHPSFVGYLTLGGTVLRELARRKSIEGFSTIDLPLDGDECARHFGLGADAWATALDRSGIHYHRVSGYRYDPAARLKKSWRYAEAAKKIRAGISIENVGLAGFIRPARPASPGDRPSPHDGGS